MEKPVDLRQVRDLAIPFDDNSFDVIVSWSVLHYNGTRSAVSTVVDELFRVLKKGGILFLSTIHPDSSVLDRMSHMGDGTYLIKKSTDFDNRDGLEFFVSGSSDELCTFFHQFSSVKTGKVFFNLCNHDQRNAWYLVYAKK
jgi:ubiquinone/menaquinone biosynthesis C-methylase UbiE